MTSPQSTPRRRFLNKGTPSLTSLLPAPTEDESQDEPSTNLSLRKSSTFHSPTTPPSHDDDPILNIPLLPRRSPTCPKDLEDAVISGDDRIRHLLGVVDRSLSGLETFSTDSQDTLRAEDPPLPRGVLDAHVREPDKMDIDQPSGVPPSYKRRTGVKHHSSDSGIGSTVSSSNVLSSRNHPATKQESLQDSGISSVNEIKSGINGNTLLSSGSVTGSQHALSEYACRHIQKHLIAPIIGDDSLKPFHPLVRGIPYRVGRKEITCLRDLEKVLLWLAPCLHTTVEYLSEPDQRRPTDRPYTNGYFLDLTEQVRQYAAMISATRARMRAGEKLTDDDCTTEQLRLHGGLSQTGRPVELVRTENGRSISLRTGVEIGSNSGGVDSKRSTSDEADKDPLRSMGRRRKSAQATAKEVQQCRECDKTFKRPCDLTKHEKTHSRPWKCAESSCKYHQYGWPTEKERDRHVNDKHSATPSMYRCQYRPCPYESKRESNCKQHMEKAHGWAYVRSKNNGKTKRKSPSGEMLPTPKGATPSSFILEASSPEFGEVSNSARHSFNLAPSLNGSDDSMTYSATTTPFMELDERFPPIESSLPWNEPYHGPPPTGPYTPESRLSMDPPSLSNTSIGHPPFETMLLPNDQDPLFTENFDWSNLSTDHASLNIQLVTPESSTQTHPLDAFSRNPSISFDELPCGQLSSLSPGAQGNVMLYSPYSQNDGPVDEGFDEFATDVGKPAADFPLFDSPHPSSSLHNTGNMFQDLASFVPTTWSSHEADLTQQLGANQLMEVDDE
ncbi:MAG: hypothetical protein LQ342_004885 [Letrouitia transgressa]|nr:MAG: hypothetical protein LQ342_004885 [Letrouitia transgressa]